MDLLKADGAGVQKVPGEWNIVHTGNERARLDFRTDNPKAFALFRVTNSAANGDAGADLHYERTHENHVEALNTVRQ
jgi:hypothetical protein